MIKEAVCPGCGGQLTPHQQTQTKSIDVGQGHYEFTYTNKELSCLKCAYSYLVDTDRERRQQEALDAFWRHQLANMGATPHEINRMIRTAGWAINKLAKNNFSEVVAKSFVSWIIRANWRKE